MVFTKGSAAAAVTASAKSKHGRMIGPLKRRRVQVTDKRGHHLDTVSSSPDTPAMTKTLFHVATTTTRTTACNSDKNSSSDDDSCCGGNLDTEAEQFKSVLESMLNGEEAPVEEVMKCVHNLLAIACEDLEMRKQVLSRLMTDNAVEASNSVPAPLP
jgi:hypothetical protein